MCVLRLLHTRTATHGRLLAAVFLPASSYFLHLADGLPEREAKLRTAASHGSISSSGGVSSGSGGGSGSRRRDAKAAANTAQPRAAGRLSKAVRASHSQERSRSPAGRRAAAAAAAAAGGDAVSETDGGSSQPPSGRASPSAGKWGLLNAFMASPRRKSPRAGDAQQPHAPPAAAVPAPLAAAAAESDGDSEREGGGAAGAGSSKAAMLSRLPARLSSGADDAPDSATIAAIAAAQATCDTDDEDAACGAEGWRGSRAGALDDARGRSRTRRTSGAAAATGQRGAGRRMSNSRDRDCGPASVSSSRRSSVSSIGRMLASVRGGSSGGTDGAAGGPSSWLAMAAAAVGLTSDGGKGGEQQAPPPLDAHDPAVRQAIELLAAGDLSPEDLQSLPPQLLQQLTAIAQARRSSGGSGGGGSTTGSGSSSDEEVAGQRAHPVGAKAQRARPAGAAAAGAGSGSRKKGSSPAAAASPRPGSVSPLWEDAAGDAVVAAPPPGRGRASPAGSKNSSRFAFARQ
jgi:hypothetical protein